MFHYKTLLPDAAATAALGQCLAPLLKPGLCLYLHGELGAGKTTLARALVHAAGFSGHVKSPTYALMETYPVTLNHSPARLAHFDLYRLSGAEEFIETGLIEEFDAQTLCLIEWPEQAAGALPAADIDITLTFCAAGRALELQACSEEGHACLRSLHFAPRL